MDPVRADLARVGPALARARALERELAASAVELVRQVEEGQLTEAEIATLLGVDLQTVRVWRGKQTWARRKT